MMITTHMGYGFAIAYFLTWSIGYVLFPAASMASWSVWCVIAGLVGGVVPDIDRWESIGFSHRKTLHYPIGYGLLLAIALTLGLLWNYGGLLFWMVLAACLFAGGWLHSLMDIYDGPWKDDEGVYEHITHHWIKARNWVPFASDREWKMQAGSDVLAIGISPQLQLPSQAMVTWLPGWAVALGSYFAIWLVSIAYEFRSYVPMRREMQSRAKTTVIGHE